MDEAAVASVGAARAVVLAEPTCSALGLSSSQPTPRREVAEGALRLLDSAPISELAKGLAVLLDELVVGVVEAVEECVLGPPPDCSNVAARAEVEAASWVDDFIADKAGNEGDVVSQQAAMFQLACLVADAVAEALTDRMATDRPRKSRCVRVDILDLARMVDELRRRGVEAVRWSFAIATPSRWLHR
jgi:hypothetical protein